MKQILVVFALFAALIFAAGCGDGSSQKPEGGESEKNAGELGGECYPNKTCNEGLSCDEESNLCVEDSENPTDPTEEPTDEPTNPTEPTDPTDNPTDEPTNPTTDPTPDDDADTSEPEPDEDADSTPVSDEDTETTEPTNNEDADTVEPANDDDADSVDPELNFPECSPTSATPCIDPETDLIWSGKSTETMPWADAVNYCISYSEGGLSGWHLPTISELRTLIKNCSGTQMPGGSCGVTDSCLSSSCWTETACYSCSYDSTGGHSKFGETGYFWSYSTGVDSPNYAWYVNFYYGYVSSGSLNGYSDVRCVRW